MRGRCGHGGRIGVERTINFAKLEVAKGQRERRGRNSDQLIGSDGILPLGKGQS